MFMWRRDSANISGEEPVFSVRYIGNIETLVPTGKGCTILPLQQLWENAPSEKHMKKITVQISLCGIFMNEADKKSKSNISFMSISDVKKSTSTSKSDNNNAGPPRYSRHFSIEDISFCAADKSINDRIFCWIYRNPDIGKLFLHAVICSGKEKAKTMASVMSRAFRLAYKEWKCEKQRSLRKKLVTSTSSSSSHCEGPKTSKTSTMKSEMVRMMMLMSSQKGDGDGEDGDDDDAVHRESDRGDNPAVSWSSMDSFQGGDLDLLVAKDTSSC